MALTQNPALLSGSVRSPTICTGTWICKVSMTRGKTLFHILFEPALGTRQVVNVILDELRL